METVNQVQETTAQEEKTFTQAEVNELVEKRLQRERAKYAGMADYDQLKEKAGKYDQLQEASKTELQKATDRAAALEKELEGMKHAETVRGIRAKVAAEKGIPEFPLTRVRNPSIVKHGTRRSRPGLRQSSGNARRTTRTADTRT